MNECTYLGKSGDSVLVGEQRRVVTDLEVEVNGLVREGGELVAEAELVRPVLGCCEGETVVLLFHFLVQRCAIWVLQTTVHIIVTTGYNLGTQKRIQV